MFRWLARGFAISALLAGSSHAACPTPPYTLSNGSTADATQIMANFTNVATCFAPIASPSFTGNVIVSGGTPTSMSMDVVGIGRFVSPHSGSTGGVVIRDYTGDVDGNYLQFVNSTNSSQYGWVQGLKAGGIVLGGGNSGIGSQSSTLTFYVNGSAGGLSTWSNVSDQRLKKDITTISNALDLVANLHPIRFQWRPSNERPIGHSLPLPVGEPQVGFLAQEVEKVVPEAVSKPGKGPNDVYGLKLDALIPILTAAIQEQQAEIEQLRTELATLKPAR